MNTRVYCLTLPVDDLKTSLNFYRHGLGVPTDAIGELTDADDHLPLKLENGMYLVLTLRAGFDEFTTPNQQQAAPRGVSECILSCFVGSQHEVDEILQRCAAHGGAVVGSPVMQPWGYAGYVKDPDGHLWEVLFNDKMSA
jgi:uncharacterized protein